MRYLSIDIGGKRTGLALGDDVTGIVSPLAVLHATDAAQLLPQLARAIDHQGPDALVVGLPLNMDGSAGPAARRVRAVAEQIAARFKLPLHLVDERLSSFVADQEMSQSGLTHGGKKARRDALAAAAILRDFLSRHGADDVQDAVE